MRKIILLGWAVVILLAINVLIFSKEQILAHGELMLLDLAPRDPRSLMQGDYMTLRYRLAQEIEASHQWTTDADGYAVVTLGENRVVKFVRVYQRGENLNPGEYKLHYRMRGGRVKLATDAYFFQEGHAAYYNGARYGLFRVSADGDAVISGLCDGYFNTMSAPDSTAVKPQSCL
jgi:uncharacterized membrane-anchored protein